MELRNSIEMFYAVLHAEGDSGDGTTGRHLLSEARTTNVPRVAIVSASVT